METSIAQNSKLFSFRLRHKSYGALCLLKVGILFGLLIVVGCGSGAGNPRPLDHSIAVESMKVFLETWQNEGSLESLKSRSPSIVGKDPDWDSGHRLLSFEVPPTGDDDGSNLYLDVRLQLENQNGEVRDRTIRYVIGTKPLVSIFRDN